MLPLPTPHTQLFFPLSGIDCSVFKHWLKNTACHSSEKGQRTGGGGEGKTAPEETEKDAEKATEWEEEFWINLPCAQHKDVIKMCMPEFN